MNKKILMFGVMGMFMLVLVSAALVPYLSNTVTKNIAVDSPLVLTVEEFAVVTPYNFSLQTVDFTLHNNAVVSVQTIVETAISGDNDDSKFSSVNVGEEFTTLRIGLKIPGVENLASCEDATGYYFDDGYCYWDASIDKKYTGVIEGVYYVQMGSGDVPIGAGETMYGRMQLQFNTAVEPATYTFVTEAVTLETARNLS